MEDYFDDEREAHKSYIKEEKTSLDVANTELQAVKAELLDVKNGVVKMVSAAATYVWAGHAGVDRVDEPALGENEDEGETN